MKTRYVYLYATLIASATITFGTDHSDMVESLVNKSSFQEKCAYLSKGAYTAEFEEVAHIVETWGDEWSKLSHKKGDGNIGDGVLVVQHEQKKGTEPLVVVGYSGTIPDQIPENLNSEAVLATKLPDVFKQHRDWDDTFRININCLEHYAHCNSAAKYGKPLEPSFCDVPFIFCGHSRGGALADISALHYGEQVGYQNLGVITFGQVAPFSAPLAEYMDEKLLYSAKFIGNDDIGPWLRESGACSYAFTREERARSRQNSLNFILSGDENSRIPQYQLSGNRIFFSRSWERETKACSFAGYVAENLTKAHSIDQYIQDVKEFADKESAVDEEEAAENYDDDYGAGRDAADDDNEDNAMEEEADEEDCNGGDDEEEEDSWS